MMDVGGTKTEPSTLLVEILMIATSQPILCAVPVVEVLLPSAKAATHIDFLQRKTV